MRWMQIIKTLWKFGEEMLDCSQEWFRIHIVESHANCKLISNVLDVTAVYRAKPNSIRFGPIWSGAMVSERLPYSISACLTSACTWGELSPHSTAGRGMASGEQGEVFLPGCTPNSRTSSH